MTDDGFDCCQEWNAVINGEAPGLTDARHLDSIQDDLVLISTLRQNVTLTIAASFAPHHN